MRPVVVTGDMKQAFLQISIKEEERDALRFHWLKNPDEFELQVYRFTRLIFGLGQSPFILGGTIEEHLKKYLPRFQEIVEEIMRVIYVDDIIGGADTMAEAQKFKETCIKIFDEAKFKLHKWHSNVPELESDHVEQQMEETYAKEQLKVQDSSTAILGVPWNKTKDSISVTMPTKDTPVTKRGILQYLASIYDPLGLSSPVQLVGKMIYRDACEMKIAWDTPLEGQLLQRWKKWRSGLQNVTEIPRSIPCHREAIQSIDLHGFGDASKEGSSAAVYTVVYQKKAVQQGLLVAKSRLSKRNLSMPRLELVASHMTGNLLKNTIDALTGFPIGRVTAWSDSTTVLHWLKGNGKYKQFVNNRVEKIKEIKEITSWRYVNTNENPSDIGSRGCTVDKLYGKWLKGPEWLADYEKWPDDVITAPSKESESEAKLISEVIATTIERSSNTLDKLLQKFSLWKTLRITAWMMRFIKNIKVKKEEQQSGPLVTQEIQNAQSTWIKLVQEVYEESKTFQEDKERLNLKKNNAGIYVCHGRVVGDYPIYLPRSALFTEKLVMDAHLNTLHGGVGDTMTKVREKYWIPRLRQLTKSVRYRCNGCKRFQAIAFPAPPQGNLPIDRTRGSRGFQVIGLDYAGPIYYMNNKRRVLKSCLLLYCCSLTRAVYIDLLTNQKADTFITSLKRFVARRGRPQKIYSDNGSTFLKASKWLKRMAKEEKVCSFLAKREIKWQFNLSRAPWWGGQFERLVGLVKQALYKVIGKSTLRWNELESVVLDVETTLNNRPLGYVDDDFTKPVLTPNLLILGDQNATLDDVVDSDEEIDVKKQLKRITTFKERVWKRWTNEYLKSLRERHNLKHKSKEMNIKVGDVVIIKGDEKNRAQWYTGIVVELLKGRDGVIRAAKLRAGKSYLERAVQQLYPLELTCDWAKEGNESINHRSETIKTQSRPKRDAAVAARLRLQDAADI